MRDAKHSSVCRLSFAFWKGSSLLSRFREPSSNRPECLSFRASGGISKRKSGGTSSMGMFAGPFWLNMAHHHMILSRRISRSVHTSSRLHKHLAFPPGNSSISVAGRYDNLFQQIPPAMRSNIPHPLNWANHLHFQSNPACSSGEPKQGAGSLPMKKEAGRESRVAHTCNGCSRRLGTKWDARCGLRRAIITKPVTMNG